MTLTVIRHEEYHTDTHLVYLFTYILKVNIRGQIGFVRSMVRSLRESYKFNAH